MTKAELIRKIAKRAGVPDSEAKVFFEIFLKKSSELLSPGEALLLKGFGHFQFRKGKIRTNIQSTSIPEKEPVFVDLMVYYPAGLLGEDISESTTVGKEEIIFNVPAFQVENYNPLDAHFSFSIGKPVIPLKDVSGTDFFIPLTGPELRKLVETKVDKLLSDVEIVKESGSRRTKGNEVLIIDTDSLRSHQLEFNWGETPSKNIAGSELTAKSKEGKTKSDDMPEKEISWDFGEDISKEIEEESILDTEKEETSIIEDEIEGENINWNFGATIVDEGTPQPETKTDSEENLSAEENTPLKKEEVKLVEIDPFGKRQYDNFMSEDESITENRFERVRSFSSFFDEDKSVSMPDEEAFNGFSLMDGSPQKSGTASYQEFEPDTKINEERNNEEVQDSEHDRIVPVEEEKEVTEGKNIVADDEIDTTSTTIEETSLVPGKAEEKTPEQLTSDSDEKPYIKSSVITRRLESESYYSSKGTSPIFLIALFVIVAVAVALYFYLNKTFDFSKKTGAVEVTQSTVIHPNIVERDYSIPVTYPYNNQQAVTKPGSESISPKALNEVKPLEVKKIETKKEEVKKNPETVTKIQKPKGNKKAAVLNNAKQKVNNEKTDASAFSFDKLPPPADTVKLHENIFNVGGNYTVQASSWKTKSIADQQAAKFRSKGFDAYVEKAEIPGRGMWYRVKIRNFKSMRDAENFLISNQ